MGFIFEVKVGAYQLMLAFIVIAALLSFVE